MEDEGNDNMVLQLYDPETETRHLILLSPEDYNRAINDYEFAQSLLNNEKVSTTSENEPAASNSVQCAPPQQSQKEIIGNAPSQPTSIVWTSSKKPTQKDHEATMLLLELRNKYKQKFADDVTVKNTLWATIAKELNEKGYFVGNGVEGRDKCRIKFSNLQSSFTKTCDRRRRTGEGHVKKPPYYDEMYEILGDKHKYKPVLVIDSGVDELSGKNKSDSELSDKEQPIVANVPNKTSVPNPSPNRFTEVKRSCRPKSNRDNILQQLVKMHQDNQATKKEEFQEFLRMQEVQSARRHEEIMALIATLGNKKGDNEDKKNKKRQRRVSSDSE